MTKVSIFGIDNMFEVDIYSKESFDLTGVYDVKKKSSYV